MKKKLLSVMLAVVCTISLAACGDAGAAGTGTAAPGGASSSGKGETLILGTGGTTGTYYAVGGVMATVLNDKLSLSNLTVTSTGASKANIQLIEDDEQQLATVQNDVMYYAYTGTDLFAEEGKYENFSSVAGIYDETVQIIAVGDINTVEDLRGKTVSVGDAGSGVEFNAKQVLGAYGMTFDDIKIVNAGFGDSADSLKDGKIDAAFVVAGAPTTAVVDLCTTTKINVVEVDDAHIAALQGDYPFYTKTVIPSGTYTGVDKDVQTVSVRATLIASNKISEDAIYELTKALFENKDALQEGHAKFEFLNLDDAVAGISVPFHPGAKKYYEEQGITVE